MSVNAIAGTAVPRQPAEGRLADRRRRAGADREPVQHRDEHHDDHRHRDGAAGPRSARCRRSTRIRTTTRTVSRSATSGSTARRPSAIRASRRRRPAHATRRSVFALPYNAAGVAHFGNLGRNVMYGPGFGNTDFSIIKNLKLQGSARAQFRVEVFNLFNQANLGQPGRTAAVGSTSFGVISNTAVPDRRLRVGAADTVRGEVPLLRSGTEVRDQRRYEVRRRQRRKPVGLSLFILLHLFSVSTRSSTCSVCVRCGIGRRFAVGRALRRSVAAQALRPFIRSKKPPSRRSSPAFRDGSLTCRSLVEQHLARIDAHDKQGAALNAIVMTEPRRAEDRRRSRSAVPAVGPGRPDALRAGAS